MCFGANLLKLDKAAMLEMGLRIITEMELRSKLNVYSIRANTTYIAQEYTTKECVHFRAFIGYVQP
jgi:hypothetical protein